MNRTVFIYTTVNVKELKMRQLVRPLFLLLRLSRKPLALLSMMIGVALSTQLAAQSCNSSVTATTPDSRFTINGDGTVTDKNTRLMWMRCSVGQSWDTVNSNCTSSTSTYHWIDALSTAQGDSFASKSDWRLPNIKELSSITEQACYNPSINETIFPSTAIGHYWSGSQSANGSDNAWSVHFNVGASYSYDKDYQYNHFYVRLVRGGNNK